MERHKAKWKHCALSLLWLLLVVFSAGATEAGVTLKGYTDNGSGYQYILLGQYPQLQTAATPLQPIAWRILSADQTGTSRKSLLLSEKNLDAKAFDSSGVNSQVWKDSPLRDWMNGTGAGQFKHTAYFSTAEQGALSEDTYITKDENGDELPSGVSSATDTFFALSY